MFSLSMGLVGIRFLKWAEGTWPKALPLPRERPVLVMWQQPRFRREDLLKGQGSVHQGQGGPMSIFCLSLWYCNNQLLGIPWQSSG